jgi:hypothetical protein
VPDEKDLQIALLRQQLRILERKAKPKPRLSRPEKLVLVVLTIRLKTRMDWFHKCLSEVAVLVQPETVLKWIQTHKILITAGLTMAA